MLSQSARWQHKIGCTPVHIDHIVQKATSTVCRLFQLQLKTYCTTTASSHSRLIFSNNRNNLQFPQPSRWSTNQPGFQPPPRPLLGSSLLPSLLASVSAVALNIRSQLKTESQTMDRFFAKYKNPRSEAARQKVFDGALEDPRRSWFNILGW
ncbi:hypothetical protein CGRA01v4_00463 [Colletotrichum graminicola]|nr:hypothetical protein CGRA01v4_00463 [Colletotrichum graminicola]